MVLWRYKQALLSFKAGKMKVVDKGGDKFHISPDLRKGSISLFKGPDDQLMHFAWKERPSGTVVDVSDPSSCFLCLVCPIFSFFCRCCFFGMFFSGILIYRCFGVSSFRSLVFSFTRTFSFRCFCVLVLW